MPSFDEVVLARRSVRAFLPTAVPQATLEECLSLAQHAPSNCNVQPWRVFVASGEACARVRAALLEAFAAGATPKDEDFIDTFPGEYRTKQVACAVEMYGKMGVARGDADGRLRAHRRNFELFDAPHVAVVCMERHFGVGVALDVGTWLQTFMLALTARGIGSCAQASVRLYSDALRAALGIPEGLRVLCAVSFGYERREAPVNATRQPRDPLSGNVVFRT